MWPVLLLLALLVLLIGDWKYHDRKYKDEQLALLQSIDQHLRSTRSRMGRDARVPALPHSPAKGPRSVTTRRDSNDLPLTGRQTRTRFVQKGGSDDRSLEDDSGLQSSVGSPDARERGPEGRASR